VAFWKALEEDYKTPKVCGPKFRNIEFLWHQILKFGCDFFEIDEFCFTYIVTFFEKPMKNATSPQNYVGQSSETKKVIG